MIELGYHHIHKSAALLTESVDNHIVGRSNHDDGYKTNMLRQTSVFLAVALEVLLGATLHTAIHYLGFRLVGGISALEHKKLLAMTYHLRVGGADTAATERQIVYGVENIGLTHPIMADKTIYLRREVESDLTDVLIVQYGKFFECHCPKMRNFSAKLQVVGGKSKKSRNKISLYAYFLLILPRTYA